MRKTAICLGLTHDFEFAAGVVILNFAQIHGINDFDFIIFSDKNLPRLKKILSSQEIEVKVIKYRPPISWIELYASRSIRYFSPMVLSKFESFSLLENYACVLWLDYDLVIRKPLTELLGDDSFDFAYQESAGSVTDGFHRPPDYLNGQQRGMSAHLFVLRNTFPNHKTARDRLYQIFSTDPDNFYFPEQAAIDILISERDFVGRKLDVSKYNRLPEDVRASEDVSVVHSWGPEKLWGSKSVPDWDRMFSNWVGLGGKGFSRTKTWGNRQVRRIKFIIARVLRLFRDLWENSQRKCRAHASSTN